MFTKDQINRAGHALWQTAVASGGVGEIAKSVTAHSVNVPGVEQGLIVAGAAVGASVLSFGKSWLANYQVTHKNDKAVRDAAKLDVLVQAVERAYDAKHTAAPVVASV